jgi:hypothetical protein
MTQPQGYKPGLGSLRHGLGEGQGKARRSVGSTHPPLMKELPQGSQGLRQTASMIGPQFPQLQHKGSVSIFQPPPVLWVSDSWEADGRRSSPSQPGQNLGGEGGGCRPEPSRAAAWSTAAASRQPDQAQPLSLQAPDKTGT